MELRLQALQQAYIKLTQHLACKVDENDNKAIQPKLAVLEDLARLQNRSISLYDISSKTFLIKTDRHMQLLGYAGHDIGIPRFHNLIHPDDLPFLYDSELQMYCYLRCIGLL